MRKEDFQNQLIAATYRALRFGQEYVKNRLSMNVQYLVVLNENGDFECDPEFTVYHREVGKFIICETDDEVVENIFHKDKCPVWIDIAVTGVEKDKTMLSLSCSGRCHHDENRMYYYEGGAQPFGIKSPTLPIDWKDGEKFKIGNFKKAVTFFENQYEKTKKWQNQQVDPIVTTPVDEVEAQGTQGHP